MANFGRPALIIAGLLATPGGTAAEVPAGTRPVAELAAAQEEAARARKPVAILMGDSNLEKENYEEALKLAVRSLRGYAVVVFADNQTGGLAELPPAAYTAATDPKLGTFIPRFTLLAPDLSAWWGGTDATLLGSEDARRFLRRAEDQTEIKMAEWAPDKPLADLREAQLRWPMKENRYGNGKFVDLDGEWLNLEGKNGEKGRYAVADMTEASLAFARELAGAAPAVAGGFEIETWTSNDGKTLEAKFVSLDGESVTLETAAGKRYTLPLERLDSFSAARAQQLGDG